jgi:23S rRNA pseudouridine2605 synthase
MKENNQDPVPLNKYLAQAGIASRRHAVDLIREGSVTVNHFVVTDPAFMIEEKHTVRINNKAIKPEPLVYLVLNKPAGYVTTLSDPHHEKTVMDLLYGAPAVRLYPVGRLDYDTTGVLLMTNDGDLAQSLAHPKFVMPKTYQVMLNKPLEEKDADKLFKGVTLRDGRIRADSLYVIPAKRTIVSIGVHSGKNRIVRRMFRHLGYYVEKLERTAFAGINVKGLQKGHWRQLTSQEVWSLKMLSESKGK